MIGNCPKIVFSLMTGPSLYWKHILAVKAPVYDVLACLHWQYDSQQNLLSIVFDKQYAREILVFLGTRNLLRAEVMNSELPLKKILLKVGAPQDYQTRVHALVKDNPYELFLKPSAGSIQISTGKQLTEKKTIIFQRKMTIPNIPTYLVYGK